MTERKCDNCEREISVTDISIYNKDEGLVYCSFSCDPGFPLYQENSNV